MKTLDTLKASVVVVGGGVAGAWTSYKLVRLGIKTILITYFDSDRGGPQGSTLRSVGAINKLPSYQNIDFSCYMDELGKEQTHPSISKYLRSYLERELEEVASIFELTPIVIGVKLREKTSYFLQKIYELFKIHGGQIVNGWVTRLVVDENTCQGLQYETSNSVGKILASNLVLASGGYASLFPDSINNACFGNVLGQYLCCGGLATNLEFIFQHGYGNSETNELIPTEELGGAEIYDDRGNRIVWLEKLLFDGKGTTSHLQAIRTWLSQGNSKFFVDFSFQKLYSKMLQFNSLQKQDLVGSDNCLQQREQIVNNFMSCFPEESRTKILDIISSLENKTIDYETFNRIKNFAMVEAKNRFRVKPISYFSMGGIAHVDFCTNLKNVYANGECIHDFGANRIGGLPWGLYLVGGGVIAERISAKKINTGFEDFDLIVKESKYDRNLLSVIRKQLNECFENGFNSNKMLDAITCFQNNRRELIEREQSLDDGIYWLIVAEAIIKSSACRLESRGYFFRTDFPVEDRQLNKYFTCSSYNKYLDLVDTQLVDKLHFFREKS